MMEFRLAELERTLEGFRDTGVLLVARQADRALRPAGFSDDLGTYLLAPPLAHWLGEPVGRVAEALHVGAIVLSAALAAAGILWLLREWKYRVPALLCMLWYVHFVFRVHVDPGVDVYVYYALPLLATVPMLMAAVRHGGPRWMPAVFALSGLLAGVANGMRANSGLPVLLLGAVLIWAAAVPRARRWLLAAALLGGLVLPHLGMQAAVQYRESYLHSRNPGYGGHTQGHPFWHIVYIGLGYLPNPYGLEYLDEVAFDKVAALDPSVRRLSPESEALLRNEVRQIVLNDPGFVARTLLAKVWLMFLSMRELRLLWFGVLVCWGIRLWRRHRVPGTGPWRPLLAWSLWAATGYYALPGLLALPLYPYYAGVFTCVLIYLLVLLDALQYQPRPAPGSRPA